MKKRVLAIAIAVAMAMSVTCGLVVNSTEIDNHSVSVSKTKTVAKNMGLKKSEMKVSNGKKSLNSRVSLMNDEKSDFEYYDNEDGTVNISCYYGTDTDIVIPAVIDGQDVYAIDMNAFFMCDSLESVTISEGIQHIETNAFYECVNLESVTIPSSVEYIGQDAFLYCESLTSIDVSEDNSDYCSEDGVLFNKAKTKLIKYPEGKTDAGYLVPDTVKSIENSAFYYCYNLESISAGSVISIGEYAFGECYSLTWVGLSEELTVFEPYTFAWCEALVDVSIPDGVTSIGNYAFTDCYSLNSPAFPEGLISIGECAYYGCSFTTVTLPAAVKNISPDAFDMCEDLESINVSADNLNYCSVDGVLFDKDVTEVIRYPGGKSGASYEIPTTVGEIGYSAFYNAVNLETVTILASITTIGDYAFGKSGLKEVVIHNGVKEIGEAAFYECSYLEIINIPDSVTSIGAGAVMSTLFYNNESNWDNGALYCGNHLLEYSGEDAILTINSGVKTIAAYACGTDALIGVMIPESVIYIGEGAFDSCYSLWHVCYEGTAGDWYSIDIADNIMLSYSIVHYNAEQITVEETEKSEATCTEAGYADYYCSECDDEYVVEFESLGHIAESIIYEFESTCTEQGYTTFKCFDCGEEFNDAYMPTLTHTIVDGTCIQCSQPEDKCIESTHNYADECDETWVISRPGAASITLTFSEESELEDGFDFVYIYDGDDKLIGEYTGYELAGKEIIVNDDVVKIQLVSDYLDNYYGFAVTNIEVDYPTPAVTTEPTVAATPDVTTEPTVTATPVVTTAPTASVMPTVAPTKQPVKKSIKFTKKKIKIKKGKKATLKVKIKGAKKAKFSIDKKGKKVIKLLKKKAKKVVIKGKKKGKAIVTAKAVGKKSKCRVTVK